MGNEFGVRVRYLTVVRHRRDVVFDPTDERLTLLPFATTTELDPEAIVRKALTIAGDLCIYTNQQHTIEVLE